MLHIARLSALLAVALMACSSASTDEGPVPSDDAGAKDSGIGGGGASASGPTFAEVSATALSGCTGFPGRSCHGSAPFGGGLDLSTNAWSNLVNVDSTSHPGVLRVKPGDPGASMLVRKLTNQLASDGSEGEPMPQGEAIQWSEPPYTQLVRDWILAGAPKD